MLSCLFGCTDSLPGTGRRRDMIEVGYVGVGLQGGVSC